MSGSGETVPGWLVLVALAACGVMFYFMSGGISGEATDPPPPPDPKKVAIRALALKNLTWRKGGFDNVMQVTVTFVNKGQRPVKDIELTCTHESNSGTVIDSNARVIYELVKPGTSKTVRDFNMGFMHSQAARSGCEITDLIVM